MELHRRSQSHGQFRAVGRRWNLITRWRCARCVHRGGRVCAARGGRWSVGHLCDEDRRQRGAESRQGADLSDSRFARWSHDGKLLAFDVLGTANSHTRMYSISIDGNGLTNLGDQVLPDWSPDDKQIAFQSEGGRLQPGVCVQNRDGQGRVRLAPGEGPRWSPDGGSMRRGSDRIADSGSRDRRPAHDI